MKVFQKLILNESNIITVIDANGNVMEVSHGFCRLTGLEREELVGKKHRLFDAGLHEPYFFDEIWTTVRAGKSWQGEIRYQVDDTGPFMVQTLVEPQFNEKGEVSRFFTYHLKSGDDEKKLENSQSPAISRLLFKHSGDPIFLLSNDNKIISANDTACHYFQLSQEEILNAGFEGLLKGMSAMHTDLLSLVLAEPGRKGEISFHKPDGTYITASLIVFEFEKGLPFKQALVVVPQKKELLSGTSTIVKNIINFAGFSACGFSFDTAREVFSFAAGGPDSLPGFDQAVQDQELEAFLSTVYPIDMHIFLDKISRLKMGESYLKWEFRIRDEFGQLAFFLIEASPVKEADGSIQFVRGTILNISSLKRAENLLKEAEDNFLKAFKVNTSPMLIVIPGGAIVDANPAFERISEYAYNELIGKSPLELNVYVESEDRGHIFEELITTGTVKRKSIDFRSKHGDIHTYLLSIETISIQGTKYWMSMLNEVVDVKAFESKIKESEMLYRSLSETSIDLVALHYPNGDYIYLGPSVEKILGYTESELIGTNAFEIIHPDEVESVRAAHEANLLQRHSINGMVCRFKHKTHGYVWIEMNATPIIDPETREIKSLLSISKDITDRVNKEQEIIRQNKELVEHNRRLKEISWIQSHEIRKPVANILGCIGLLDLSKLSAEDAEVVAWIKKSSHDLDEIIKKVVDTAII